MLYMGGGGRVQRVHGPFVSDEEVEKVVSFLKKQGVPDYIEQVTQEPEEAPEMEASSGDDFMTKRWPLSPATGAPRPAMCKGGCPSAITAPPD